MQTGDHHELSTLRTVSVPWSTSVFHNLEYAIFWGVGPVRHGCEEQCGSPSQMRRGIQTIQNSLVREGHPSRGGRRFHVTRESIVYMPEERWAFSLSKPRHAAPIRLRWVCHIRVVWM